MTVRLIAVSFLCLVVATPSLMAQVGRPAQRLHDLALETSAGVNFVAPVFAMRFAVTQQTKDWLWTVRVQNLTDIFDGYPGGPGDVVHTGLRSHRDLSLLFGWTSDIPWVFASVSGGAGLATGAARGRILDRHTIQVPSFGYGEETYRELVHKMIGFSGLTLPFEAKMGIRPWDTVSVGVLWAGTLGPRSFTHGLQLVIGLNF